LRRAAGCRSVLIPDGRPAAAEIFPADLPDAVVHPDELVPALPQDAFLAALPVVPEMAGPVERGIAVPALAARQPGAVLPVRQVPRQPGLQPQAAARAVLPLDAKALPERAHPALRVPLAASDELLGVARSALPRDAVELPAVARSPPAQQVAWALQRSRELLVALAQRVFPALEVRCAQRLRVLAPQTAPPVSQMSPAQVQPQAAAPFSLSPRRSLPPRLPPPLPRGLGNASAPTPRARCRSSSSASSSP